MKKIIVSSCKGFTLIELLIFIVLLGILASIIIPRVGKGSLYNKQVVYTTARRIGVDMRLARRLAISTGDSHRVFFFTIGSGSDYNAYKIQRDTGSWVDVGETKSIPDEIVVSGAQLVQFSSNGAANANLDFQYELTPYEYNINVKQNTGRVKIEQI